MSEEKAKNINIEAAEEETAVEQADSTSEDREGQQEAEQQTEQPEKQDDATGADAAAEAEASPEEQESERYMRLMAEFQNYKRRAAREKSDIHAYANEKLIGELLPVLDNFERALETGAADAEGFAKGMELIFTQMKTALENAGLAEIPALGEEFDPNIHNAVMTEDSDEQADGHISKVLQKGYKLKDKVIRPSMVAVVRR